MMTSVRSMYVSGCVYYAVKRVSLVPRILLFVHRKQPIFEKTLKDIRATQKKEQCIP